MKINVKAVAGVGAAAFAATGWGLYGSSGSSQPTTLTKEEENPCCEKLPIMADALNQINADVKQQQRFVWEINARDSIIDYKNGQIEELNKDLEKKEKDISSMTKSTIDLVSRNLSLQKKIKELEKENKRIRKRK